MSPGYYVRKYRTEGLSSFSEDDIAAVEEILADKPHIRPLQQLMRELDE